MTNALDPWQREDGFPRVEYFAAVMAAIEAAGITVDDYHQDDPWDFNLSIARKSYKDGPLSYARHGLWVTWRTAEDDEPKHADDFTGMGWYWVPYTKPNEALGDFAKQFELPYLAEPAEVAAAIVALVRGT